MTKLELLTENQEKCWGCYKARADYLPLCEIYQSFCEAGVLDTGERCAVSRILDEDLKKLVLHYDNPVYEAIARALMEDPPIERAKKVA